MNSRPFILITNDDGVHAPGIRHLWMALKDWADVVVVAPAHEQSAVGLSITIRHPLHIVEVKWPTIENQTETDDIWSVNGTPADCVKLALNVILSRPPDLIVSGINRGTNAGRNVLYSGTIAGVIEGIMHDIPGIAFSTADYFHPNYATIERHIPSIIHYTLTHSLPRGTFLNVNFPRQMNENFKGICFAKQGQEYWAENPEQRSHPTEGSPYYWLGAKLAEFEEDEESDIIRLRQGFATVVPIYIGDMTHHPHLNLHREKFEEFINQ